MGLFKNRTTEAQRSESLGRQQRNEDNRAGGEGRGGTVRIQGWGTAKDEESFVKGYTDHGDKHLDWF